MAKDWYLMNTNHDTVSGFESDDFENFASDALDEALASSVATEVEICNYDLSIRTKARVIVEGNVQDTKLNSLKRRLITKIGATKAGQYIYYKDRYWLIEGVVDDNGLYDKGVMTICNYKLSWLNEDGNPVSRWCFVTSASQYNSGETSTQFMYIRTDQVMIVLPNDEESMLIPHGKRVVIDERCKIYEKRMSQDITVNTSNPLLTWEVTRQDNVLFSYQDSGHAQYMIRQDEQHNEDGYYVIDGVGYWLCEQPPAAEETLADDTIEKSCRIVCEAPAVYCGGGETVFNSVFYAGNVEDTEAEPTWEINCGFVDKLSVEYVDNSICISADNEKLIGKSFELSLHSDGYDDVSIVVGIKALI